MSPLYQSHRDLQYNVIGNKMNCHAQYRNMPGCVIGRVDQVLLGTRA